MKSVNGLAATAKPRSSYNGLLTAVPLDLSEISSERLNIEAKARSNLFPWNGQFSPQFIEALLNKYAASEMRILDPFCGSGTVLYECGRLGLCATGIEVNPAAYLLARTYMFCNIAPAQRSQALDSVEQHLLNILDSKIINLQPDNPDSLRANGHVLLEIAPNAHGLERVLLETFIILADFYKGSASLKLKKTWLRLRKIVEEFPLSTAPLRTLIGDGRYPNNSEQYDLVITSPPYINVYNYHQQYRTSAEALGWKLLEVARTEIGSNRKNRGNRFLTVIQYCLDLAITLESLWSVTTPQARLIFILGRESRVRGVSFLNGEIFAQLAVNAVGYKLTLRQERVFTNRFGQRIYEDIIHITKDSLHANVELRARNIAKMFLIKALKKMTLANEVKLDVEKAIKAVGDVARSPIFDPRLSYNEFKLRKPYDLSNPTFGKAHCNFDERETA